MTLSHRDLSYVIIPDLRERYHSGDTYTSVIKDYDVEKEHLTISVKEAEPYPFDGAKMRHPLRSRRVSYNRKIQGWRVLQVRGLP